jgi:hypothetical protein
MKNQRGILFVKNKQLLNTWLLVYCLQVLNFKKLFNKYLRIPKKLSPEAQQLLNNMLNNESLKRFQINQILNHHWIK